MKKMTQSEKKLNHIGLELSGSKELVFKLNDLLTNRQLFYINARGFHWNIKGEKFFELHLKFEELYTNLQIKIDEVAERVLTLGETPVHSYSEYLKSSSVTEQINVSDGKQAVKHILDTFNILLKKERDILKLSSEVNDEGTNALMSDYIREQEKMVWMYSSYLSN
jgi:starvation-inducible DNA-binding protein